MSYGLGRYTIYHFLKFGDVNVKHLQPSKISKLDMCVFVGYPRVNTGYSFYNKTKGKEFITKNNVFLEEEIIEKGLGKRTVQLEEVREPE
jgi:hypothetical protein